MDQKLPVMRMSAENMSPEEQFESMKVAANPFSDLQLCSTAQIKQFKAESTWYLMDNIVMSQSRYSALKYRRDQKKISQNDDLEHYIFHLSLKGNYTGVSGQHDLRSDAGSITVMDTREEIYGQSTDCNLLSVVMPRQLLENADLLHSTTLATNSVKTKVLREHILTLWRTLPDMKMAESCVFSRGLASLINAFFTTEANLQSGDVKVLDASILTAMKNSIEQNLGNTRLGVNSLCSEFHCSRATLYRLFQTDGGVARYIRERRLVAAFKVLSNCRVINKRIIDVAIEHGFTNQSIFSRLFRQYFGITPSEAITLSETHAPPYRNTDQKPHSAECIADWLKSL